MFKKTITAAVLGVSALSIMAANAATPGPYITGQLGYAKSEFSQLKGFKDKDHAFNKGLAGRLAAGYQFNQNFAVEAGYLQLGSKRTDDDTTKLSQNAIDLNVKGILPIASNFNAYAKVGMAYLSDTMKFDSVAETDIPHASFSKWAPEVALGMSYDITPSVSVDASLTHIHPSKNDNNLWNLHNVNFFAVGVGYNFG